ncbi:haloacid dehalogenase-like hydrolase family member protein [Theileria equi strain WA]|uniref:Haloacid dehalogenase-like hydrolase family member protein n=1 Tax=Theileria equi strain WA TaxID=1537102 RepID=L1LBV2_THEEQ|nr:haloacid dehalogenase-like hydrolase family member protein [Theileria equi strain WA]EKX72658.1 haloacid dehalogenase-like hydrolase family member protein [Theileria equi strain WA]|eukprot:XP_004832110.1 haloacid dehalogenase-like hydrolase family member protein [Theileria equi strain WA]
MLFIVLIIALTTRSLTVGGLNENESRLKGDCDAYSPLSHLRLPRDTSGFVKPEEPPKYFGIDIDGTLLAKNKEVWERNIEAFAETRRRGYIPFLCTGRAQGSSLNLIGGKTVMEKISYRGYPGVYKNGAVIFAEDGKVLSMHIFPKEFLKILYNFLVANELIANILFYDEEELFSLVEDNKVLKKMTSGKSTIPKIFKFEDMLKKNILMLKYQGFELNVPEFKEGIDYIEKVDVNGTHDLSPSGVTKASGIQELMEHYGLSTKDCGFIGDGYNDVEAMELCEYSFAVANAPDEVKRHAKFVLDKTCDQAAVAEALELMYGPFTVTSDLANVHQMVQL